MFVLLQTALAARPEAAGFVDSTTVAVRCHHLDGQAALCDPVLAAVEEAWAAQVDGLGFPAPPPDAGRGGSDALDVYLTHDGTGGAGGAYVTCDGAAQEPCADLVAGDGLASTPTYVVIDPDTATEDLRGYAHHEFNHVLQYAIDFEEPFLDVWEGTAVAAEAWTDPDMVLDPGPIDDYQRNPWVSALLQDGYWLEEQTGRVTWYEYGATVWVRWLDERHGDGAGSIGPALWLAFANDPGANEPDVLDAWTTLAGTDWRDELPDFVRMRARLGTEDAPAWATSLGVRGQVRWEEDSERLDGRWVASRSLQPLGMAFVVHAGGLPVEALDGTLLVDLDAADGTPAATRLEPGDGGRYAIVATPDAAFDADDTLVETEGGVVVGEAGACGCAAAEGAGWAAVAAAGVALAGSRARRR
jgi:hypothetical protein